MLTSRQQAGLLLFAGTSWAVLAIISAETLTPGYTATRMISDLGTGPAALTFNTAVFAFGILTMLSAWLLLRSGISSGYATLLAVTGAGAAGVGLFLETVPLPHAAAAVTLFIFGGITAIAGYRVLSGPWAYISPALGIFSLAAALLFASRIYLGLSAGGMERMIAAPLLLWAAGMGVYLMTAKTE